MKKLLNINFVIILFLLSACAGSSAAQLATATMDMNAIQTSVAQIQAPLTQTTVPSATSTPASRIPVPNSLYLGKVEGRDGLFVTNSGLQLYYEDGVEKIDPFIGLLTFFDDGQHIQPFHFNGLENPKQLFSLQNQILGVANFVFDAEREQFIVSLILLDDEPWPNNKIYRVTIGTQDYQEVWMNEIGSGSRYGESKGSADIVLIKENYLVLNIMDCYACETFSPSNALVLNLTSGEEKMLGSVGSVSIDLQKNIVSYQQLAMIQVSCEPSPGCDIGYRTIYEPAGEVYTEELP